MLQSKQIRSCLHHAEECAHRAKIEPDPNLARGFLNMERRWLNLALSHAFAERLEAFAEHNEKRRKSATSFAEKGKATAHNRARIEARLDALTCEIAALARANPTKRSRAQDGATVKGRANGANAMSRRAKAKRWLSQRSPITPHGGWH